MPADGESKGRPLIPEAERDDWCTPKPVTPFIYDTLGRPVDLDAASNAQSIVQVKRAIWWEQLRDPSVDLPAFAEWGDGIEVLKNVAPGTTVFLNPPFGREEVPRWVEACAIAYSRGAEIIALVPSYTSSYWFDHLYQTANKICFWGLPGETTSRLRFGDSSNGAGFAVLFAYWGPNADRFTRVWSRAGQIWHIDRDRLLTAQICRHRIPEVPTPDVPRPSGALFDYAERRHRTARYDALLHACSDVMDETVANLMHSDAESLKQQFGALTLGEVLNGLNLAADVDSLDRPVRRARTGRRGSGKSEKPEPTAEQILLEGRSGPRSSEEIARFDEQVLAAVESSGDDGKSIKELEEELKGGTRSQLRDSLKRLRKGGMIRLEGERKSARYYTGEHRHGQHET